MTARTDRTKSPPRPTAALAETIAEAVARVRRAGVDYQAEVDGALRRIEDVVARQGATTVATVAGLQPLAVGDEDGARLLGIGRTTFRGLDIPSELIGRRRVWLVSDIDEYAKGLPVVPMPINGTAEDEAL